MSLTFDAVGELLANLNVTDEALSVHISNHTLLSEVKLCLEVYSRRMKEKCIPRSLSSIPICLLKTLEEESWEEKCSWDEICGIFQSLLPLQTRLCQRETIERIKGVKMMDHSMYMRLLHVALTTADEDIASELFDKEFILDIEKQTPKAPQHRDRFYFAKYIAKEWFVRNEVTQREPILKIFIEKLDAVCLTHIIPEILPIEFQLFSDNFWSLTCKKLALEPFSKQPVRLSMIEAYVSKMYQNGNLKDICGYMRGKTEDLNDFRTQWSHFRDLFSIAQEQQPHLVGPAIPNLDNIEQLHFDWRLCILTPLLRQKNPLIAYPCLYYVLLRSPTFDLCEYKKFAPFFLEGLNRNDAPHNHGFYNNLRGYVKSLGEQNREVLAECSAKCNWVPNAAYYFYSAVCSDIVNHVTLLPILKNLERIPHKYIRDGCYNLLFEVYRNLKVSFDLCLKISIAFYEYDLDYVVEIMTVMLNSGYKKLLYVELVNSMRRHEADGKLKMLLTIINQMGPVLEVPVQEILDSTEDYTPITSDLMFAIFAASYPARALRYVKHRLEFIELNDNIEYLIEILNRVQFGASAEDLKIVARGIVDRKDYSNLPKLTVAVKILNQCDSDNQILQLLQNEIWFKSIELCKLYIKLLPSLIHNESILQIIKPLIQEQPQEVVNFLYKNLPIIVEQHVQNNREYSDDLFEYLITQLKYIKSKEDRNICFRGFLKAFLACPCILKNLDAWGEKLIALLTSYSAELIFLETVEELDETWGLLPHVLVSVMQQLTRYGNLYTKERSMEYAIYRKIYDSETVDGRQYLCLHDRELRVRLRALLRLLKEPYRADVTIEPKKYFPNSEDHMRWLRSAQAALTLLPTLTTASDEEISALHKKTLSSLLLVTHHSSVRQLLQWLLIRISTRREHLIHSIYDAFRTNKINVTAACSLIPIMYHVAMATEESHARTVLDMLGDAAMGANFKLRAYAQVAMLGLLEFGKLSHDVEYKWLCKTLRKAVGDNKESIYKVLKTDREFIKDFNPEKCYNLHSIFKDIPHLNGVTALEWDSFDQVHQDLVPNDLTPFIEGEMRIKIPEEVPVRKDDNAEEINFTRGEMQVKMTPALHEQSWKHDVILVASFVASAANIGGLARTCEIFGVRKLVVKDLATVKTKDFQSLSMGAEKWLDVREVRDLEDFVQGMKSDGYRIVGAEQTSQSVNLHEFTFPVKCVIVLGSEQHGIPATFLPNIDVCVEINQYGVTRSLNVHVAGATFIWEYVRQRTQNRIE